MVQPRAEALGQKDLIPSSTDSNILPMSYCMSSIRKIKSKGTHEASTMGSASGDRAEQMMDEGEDEWEYVQHKCAWC